MPFTSEPGSFAAALGVPLRRSASEQTLDFKRREATIGALEDVLGKLPIGDARRSQIEQAFDKFRGVSGLGSAIVPEEPKRGRIIQPGTEGLPAGVIGAEQPSGQIDLMRAQAGTGATVNVGGGEGFGGAAIEDALGKMLEAGQQAAGVEANYQEMLELISSPSLQTGALQPALTTIQAIAEDAGLDVGRVAGVFGVEVGKLSAKEDFNRVASDAVLEKLNKLKGSISNKELDFVRGSQAGLGKSEEGNIEAIAAAMAATQIARRRGVRALDAFGAKTNAAGMALLKTQMEGDVTELRRLKDEIAEGMKQERRSGSKPTSTTVAPQRRLRVQSLPQGAKLIGTLEDGRQIYQSPDGQLLMGAP